ncbi:hypothetical protein CJF30_00007117 [Rutstroemia sp. NJR-2017a BBW]|nr:hypothetical protein CJF30_00007117 [Rutstroemia sp. NJR-2017a BBW]
MAPHKRTRWEDDEVVATESASSRLQHDEPSHFTTNDTDEAWQQRKRVRVSMPEPSRSRVNGDEASSSSSEDESDNNVEDDEDMSMPPGTQYEIIRDAGFKHLENPDLDDQIATQRFLANTQQIGENHAAENSIIEEVTCINFMNHEKLHVKLGPLINFVVGMNGSGKSAVLTAITLCLGGKPSSTNRGTSMKSLIKNGTDQGMLIVKLKNQGNDAYQPDVYGKSIIVERHFSLSGGSNYKLKSATGRTISNKKSDLDDIIEYFQLQVDNPMNVLTQDEAKTFIKDSTPATKYQFFVKGVQLEQLDNDYALVSESCDQIEAKLKDTADDYQILERNLREAEAKQQIVEQHGEMKLARKKFVRQLAWCQVEEQEKELEERQKNVTEVQEKIERQERHVGERDEHYNEMNASAERAEQKIQQLDAELSPLKEQEEDAKKESDKAQKEVQNLHTSHRGIREELTSAMTRVDNIQKEIDTELKRIEDANGGSHARKLAEIEEAKEAALQAKRAFDATQDELQQLIERSQAAKKAFADEQGPLDAKRREVEACATRVRDLQNERPNPMLGYHPKMQQLINRIRDDREFREKPLGPVGLHLKLKEPKWSDILEQVLGGALNAFVVTNRQDQARLQAIMNQVGFQSNIFIGNSQRLDTSRNEPDPHFMTALRALEIGNDLIRNTLIINQNIEQTLLIENRDEAYRIMQPSSKPANVKQCFTFNPQKRGYGVRLYFSGRNQQNSATDFVKPFMRNPRMVTDSESRLLLQQETLKQLKEEEAKLASSYRMLQQKAQQAEKAIQQHRNKQGQFKVRSQKADERVDALQAEYDGLNIEDGLLENLNKQLEDAKGDVKRNEDDYGNAALEKKEANKKASEAKKAHAAAKAKVTEHENLITQARLKLRLKQDARRLALGDKNSAIAELEGLKQQKEEAEAKVQNQIERVQNFTEQAAQVYPNRVSIPPGETRASLDAQLSSLQEQLKKYSKRIGATDQEVVEALEKAKHALSTAKEYRKILEELLKLLKQSFQQRMAQFRSFQRHISARSRINFNYLLSERAFRGKLTIDHRAKLLDVHVEPDETSSNKKGRDAKTLSGGEKSFSSICLLLALWEAMGAPLRCLDEFDVFMDDVNRDVSTRMIISAARKAVGRQFILITPKALGNGVDIDEDVHIHKLPDPRDPKERRIDVMMGGA